MVAVLTVFANHLWGWPHGGFVGVDVFFVISGFLITSHLVREAEKTGSVSFKQFYLRRAKRIMPAATVVLVLTYLAALAVFLPFRSHAVGVDAVWAFLFASNWWFGYQGTDYFRASDTLSPLQHYWSLSIEEQFYFVWPAVIFLISAVVISKAWSHRRRMQLTATTMAAIITASLGWAIYETATSPAWAYFDTFARIWELGVGALLACTVGALARIPDALRPWLSWAGLAAIGASLFLIGEAAAGFPAPWAALPVGGAALVIAAGVGREPKYQAFLRNPVSGLIGDISYSLYLTHWPVIVLFAAIMEPGLAYTLTVIGLSFGLAIASYYGVEDPLRHITFAKVRDTFQAIRTRRYQAERSSAYATLGVLTAIAVGLTAFALRPDAYEIPTAPPVVAAAPAESAPKFGPVVTELQKEIRAALPATEWPPLNPSMEQAINGLVAPAEVVACGKAKALSPDQCTWGEPTAPTRIVLVGDSIALSYGGPLRKIALDSGGQIQVYVAAMAGCQFSSELIYNDNDISMAACPARKQAVVDYINTTRPDVVIVSNNYGEKRLSAEEAMTTPAFHEGMRTIVDKFRASTRTVVWLAAPPDDKNVAECYGSRSSVPADCISGITDDWYTISQAEQEIADEMNGVWMDSRPWFCVDGMCPSFVGSTPTKHDELHMSEAYGEKVSPAIAESLLPVLTSP